jgi:hypothetical protein
LDYLSTGILVRSNYFAKVFRIESARQCGRIDNIAKENSELTAFGLRRMSPDRYTLGPASG